jgi:hypothetical protein
MSNFFRFFDVPREGHTGENNRVLLHSIGCNGVMHVDQLMWATVHRNSPCDWGYEFHPETVTYEEVGKCNETCGDLDDQGFVYPSVP